VRDNGLDLFRRVTESLAVADLLDRQFDLGRLRQMSFSNQPIYCLLDGIDFEVERRRGIILLVQPAPVRLQDPLGDFLPVTDMPFDGESLELVEDGAISLVRLLRRPPKAAGNWTDSLYSLIPSSKSSRLSGDCCRTVASAMPNFTAMVRSSCLRASKSDPRRSRAPAWSIS
jgi:hypothetical protein